jgi:ribonuclease VapC
MPDFVLDASAILADLHGEPGGDLVRASMRGSVMSAVNLAEVITKLIDHGMTAEQASSLSDQLSCEVLDADRRRAASSGALHAETRRTGVSLGDRFCLALAKELNLPALTADRRWKALGLGIEVQLIR